VQVPLAGLHVPGEVNDSTVVALRQTGAGGWLHVTAAQRSVQVPAWQTVVPVQGAQVTPAEPQLELDSAPTSTQVVPLQQPAQFEGLQLPASVVPPWQTPSALQVWPPEQAWQDLPFAPQAVFAEAPTPGVRQLPVRSQQPVQLLALHAPPASPPPAPQTPCWQLIPEPHAWHCAAPTPHALLSVPG